MSDTHMNRSEMTQESTGIQTAPVSAFDGADDLFSRSAIHTFRLLRWAVALPILGAIAAVCAFVLPASVTLYVLTAEVALLGLAGLTIEFTLYRTERRLVQEREQARDRYQQQHD